MFVRFGFSQARRLLITAIGCGLSGCLTGLLPLHAVAAETEWTSYLRAGPGLQYAALDEIAAHHPLTVEHCSGGWCRVADGRAEGYVRQSLLTQTPAEPVPHGTAHDCFDATLMGYEGGSYVRFCGK